MIVLNVSKMGKAFGEEALFSDVSFQIDQKDKIGFVGVNGAGKTTLFRILLEQLSADTGAVTKSRDTKIGYLRQHVEAHSDKTVYDELLEVFFDVEEIEKQLEQIACEIERGTGDISALVEKQTRLHEAYDARGGFTYKSIAKAALLGLGFREEELTMPFASLSGGQKTRVLLCKTLLGNSNLLLLDEPTNHLDISAVEWLEAFLRDYQGAFVIISHDRYFLDRVTNKTIELENQKIEVYDGNYSAYMAKKSENRTAQQRQYENTQREIKRIEGIIEQQRRWNRERNLRTAASKQKAADKLRQTLQKPQDSPDGIGFHFKMNETGGNEVLTCENLGMAFGDKRLFSHVDLRIMRQECVFLLGANGCGKTTLFKILTGQFLPKEGSFRLGSNVKAGYYDQAQQDLCADKTVFDEVCDAYPGLSQTEIRNALAAFLFCGDDVFKTVGMLSGGEKARVSLLKLMLSGANLLLLDEPTNHLDISSREALEEALLSFEGTIFAISHDRYFINKLADRICDMSGGTLRSYVGNYDYFVEKKQELAQRTSEKSAQEDAAELSGKDAYRLQKQRESEKRKRAGAQKRIEEAIAHTEAQIKAHGDTLSLPEYATDYIKASEVMDELKRLEGELMALYEAWEALLCEADKA